MTERDSDSARSTQRIVRRGSGQVTDDYGLVFRIDENAFMDRGNGVRSFPFATKEAGSTQFLSGITEIPPGKSIPLHSHSSDEFILVLEGQAVVQIWEDEVTVGRLDATLMRQGVEHRFTNVGSTPLRILWVYADTETTRTLVESGETMGHLDSYPTT
ncbi:MAG TPA: cupin domain-containing protein [Jatrophihabitantaceae bacterium]|jgi:quercetin dioxygenase-like cupin family protein|nr:cupin domain-containing protein [Jatrophihabitantaceae bacterium]